MKIKVQNSQFTATTTPSKMLGANPNRVALFIYNNDADSNVELLASDRESYGQGTLILYGGGFYAAPIGINGEIVGTETDEIFVVAEADTCDLRIREYLKVS
jgi:hypothetical protein